MGNGTSQSIVLGPPRFQGGSPHYQRGVPRYVHPQNMVLPKPIAGQRLRCTDNGSILQSAGTIRGQRRDSTGKDEEVNPEMMGVLKRRSEMIEKENDCYHHMNLRNHRMFHSDPDITRTRPSPYENHEIADGYNQRRNCSGGAAVRASKLKYKKKARAPEPPHCNSSLPRQLDRSPPGGSYQKNQKGSPCKCVSKTKAPQPPRIAISPPPPPPPLPVTTRTNVEMASSKIKSQLSPSITRAVECNESRGSSYEKNVHPLDRWRVCRSMGDVRIDEEHDASMPSESRTTVFDSRKINAQDKKPSYLPQRNDPFQKEIQAVTKKIAKSREVVPSSDGARASSQDMKKDQVESQPKQYYFSDASAFKLNGHQKSDSSKSPDPLAQVRSKEEIRTLTDEIVPSLQRFSPTRRKVMTSIRGSTPTPSQKAERGWEHLSRSLHHRQEDESDIDIRLRPVLPRKTPDMPKFSPSEAWQALGSDGLGSSNQSTSDESIQRYGRSHLCMENRARLMPDTSHAFKQRSLSDSHWTPRQDLMDDSDISSDGSEDAVVPRMRSNTSEFPTRFSLPSVMFSNMRPIGHELSASKVPPFFDEHYKKGKQAKKKSVKNVDPVPELSSVSNFRKFLGKKQRYMSEEDIAVSDSNWTFGHGHHGLQKRGKQYSSDLMLSDRKKCDVMVKNSFGDFLGDILVTNANKIRHQMKSSDSGNSNFSFYSTEGPLMYNSPEQRHVEEEYLPSSKGRVYDIRKKFDANLATSKSSKRKVLELDLERKRDLELVRMLEDEVRKRRNKEKITIRQQLQKFKNLNSEEEEEFDDEAYFTEPKSREDPNSPFFATGSPYFNHNHESSRYSYYDSELAHHRRFQNSPNYPHLSHWQSSPALLEDCFIKKGTKPAYKGRLLSSPIALSSPDPESWLRHDKTVNSWLSRQQDNKTGLRNLQEEPSLIPIERSSSEESRAMVSGRKVKVEEDVGHSTVADSTPQRKEKRKTNIYKQLMDIVRREERNLKESQGDNPNSRESSYSQRESSHSTVSDSSSTSSYSYSDSSSSKNHSKNGVSANREFHAATSIASFPPERKDVKEPKQPAVRPPQPTFQVNFVQPYTPNKTYRPVPFDIVVPAGAN